MKLTEFENPITGKKGNLFDIGGMISMIMGVLVFLFVVSTGQNIARKVSGAVPAFDTQPESIFRQPVVLTQATTKRVV